MHVIAFVFSVSIVILDQWTKILVVNSLNRGESVEIIPGFFHFTLVHNPGAAFGMFGGLEEPYRSLLLFGTFIFAIGFILYFLFLESAHFFSSMALYAVLAGAVGNLIDRVRLGYVVDFLDFFAWGWHFPAFNVADISISVGVGLYFLLAVLSRENTAQGEKCNVYA